MTSAASNTITDLLKHWQDGIEVHTRLMPLIYRELRQIAGGLFVTERSDHTLQPTILVTEAYLKLQNSGPYESRAHFFGTAAHAMRQALIDHARKHNAKKRGGGCEVVPLDDEPACEWQDRAEILAVDAALKELELLDRRAARVVELRYFAGLDIRETAEVLGIGCSTVRSDWTRAKVWLKDKLDV